MTKFEDDAESATRAYLAAVRDTPRLRCVIAMRLRNPDQSKAWTNVADGVSLLVNDAVHTTVVTLTLTDLSDCIDRHVP